MTVHFILWEDSTLFTLFLVGRQEVTFEGIHLPHPGPWSTLALGEYNWEGIQVSSGPKSHALSTFSAFMPGFHIFSHLPASASSTLISCPGVPVLSF